LAGLSTKKFDKDFIVEGLELLYRIPRKLDIGERPEPVDFDSSLLHEAIIDDNFQLLKVLMGRRLLCPRCMESGLARCERISHYVTEEEVLKAYDLAIMNNSSECMGVFFNGIYEWNAKVKGHRFMQHAFSMGQYDFAMRMMDVHHIEINLTDTPNVNPGGDLLLYAKDNPRIFAALVEKGVNLNVEIVSGAKSISLLGYLLRFGKHDLARILFEKGVRYQKEQVKHFAGLGGFAECISLVEEFTETRK
jgi:hypothetical protein